MKTVEKEKKGAAKAAKALIEAFGWGASAEGSDYWWDVHDKLIQIARAGLPVQP